MPRRNDTLYQRFAPEVLSEDVLTRMERDGWTPAEVRALIASYRELIRDVRDLRNELGVVGHGYIKPDKHAKSRQRWAFQVVERALRSARVQLVSIQYHDLGASETLSVRAVGGREAHGTLCEAFERLTKEPSDG